MLDGCEFDLEFCFSTHCVLLKDIEDEINTIPNFDLVYLEYSDNMEDLTWFELVSDDEKVYSLCKHLLMDFFQFSATDIGVIVWMRFLLI
jgi:hypothetical protein